jgi:short-subunit dehydrogenase
MVVKAMSKNAIVIGSSSGIGFALTRALLERSFAVGACSRHLEPLQILQEKFSRERCLLQRMDVTELEEASRVLEALIEQLGEVRLIIINAGVGHINLGLDWALEEEVIKTNVLGFTALACVATKYFERRGEGQLVGISSISALRGNRQATSYAASKAYISNYLEGLNQRFVHGGLPIVATDVQPGFVDTAMSRQSPRRFWVATPEKAAEQILDAAEKRRRQAYITRRWALVAWLFKKMPRSLYLRI